MFLLQINTITLGQGAIHKLILNTTNVFLNILCKLSSDVL